jgi:serine/threonine-protein kinase
MIGQMIGNYKVIAQLGEGGMGVVYLAEHPMIGNKVAVKVLHDDLGREPQVVSRFFTEARSVAEIRHPNIVGITDFGDVAGRNYIIMEFLEGDSLAQRLSRCGILDERHAARIIYQAAGALGAAHEHGTVHRDIKPDNIFLQAGEDGQDFVKVLDFGVAKLVGDPMKASHKTRTGSVIGTPYYMSPEQATGKKDLDGRSDIYSLGVVLYEAVVGSVPFGGEALGEIIVNHVATPPTPPRQRNPRVTPVMEALILRALAKRPEDRFASMRDLRVALAPLAGVERPSDYGTTRLPSNTAAHLQAQLAAAPGLTHTPTTLSTAIRAGMDTDLPIEMGSHRSKALWIGGAIAGAAAAVALALALSSGGGADKTADQGEREGAAAVGAAALAREAPDHGAPTAAPPTNADRVASVTVVPAPVRVRVSARPEADIYRDGVKVGASGSEVDVPADGSAVTYVLRRDGYIDKPITVSAADRQSGVAVQLDHAKAASSGRRSRTSAPGKPPRAEPGPAKKTEPESFEIEAIE